MSRKSGLRILFTCSLASITGFIMLFRGIHNSADNPVMPLIGLVLIGAAGLTLAVGSLHLIRIIERRRALECSIFRGN